MPTFLDLRGSLRLLHEFPRHPSKSTISVNQKELSSILRKRPGDQADGLGGKRARTLEGISLDELRQYVGTLDSYW